MADRKLVFIKLEGNIAHEFERQRLELQDLARKTDAGATFEPEMFVSYMLDIRRSAVGTQKLNNIIEEDDDGRSNG